MGSEHDTLFAEFCSPFMVEQFGERDAQGDLAKFTYQPPDGEATELVGWILHTVNGQESINGRGEVGIIETCKITGPVDPLRAKGIDHCQLKATVKIGEQVFHVDPLSTQITFSGPLAVIGLKRQPLVNQNEMRNAGI